MSFCLCHRSYAYDPSVSAEEQGEDEIEIMKSTPFFDGTYWDYCTQIAPDCLNAFPDGAVYVDFEKLNEKREAFRWKGIESFKSAGYISLESAYIILENTLPGDFCTEYAIRLEDSELNRLRNCRLVIDETPDEFDSFVRRPYYRMRGKPVTEGQAFEVIRKTDEYISFQFHHSYSRYARKLVNACHFRNWWFDPHHFPAHYGWIHPNGIVGINGITNKYPTFLELLDELLGYQKVFPFLDFAAAITWWDENPGYECYGGKAQRNEVYGLYPDFLDNVKYGIRLDGSTVEFLGKDRAIETYQKYETLYGDPDYGVYVPGLCWSKAISRGFDIETYFRRCIAAFGLEED